MSDHTVPPAAFTASSAQAVIRVDATGDRVVVTVSGELDLDNSEMLRQTLCHALGRTSGALELDLANVAFCDCSALNMLLHLHHRAREDAKRVVLCAVSRPVARLLTLTGTLSLFTVESETSPSADSAGGDAAGGPAGLYRAVSSAMTDQVQDLPMASFRPGGGPSRPVRRSALSCRTGQPSRADAVLPPATDLLLAALRAGYLAAAAPAFGGPEG